MLCSARNLAILGCGQYSRCFSSSTVALRSKERQFGGRPEKGKNTERIKDDVLEPKNFSQEPFYDHGFESNPDQDTAHLEQTDKDSMPEVDKTKLYESVSRLMDTTAMKKIINQEKHAMKTLKDIIVEEKDRFKDKFKTPTANWIRRIKLSLGQELDRDVSEIPVSSLLKEAFGSPKESIHPLEIFDSLNIGDAVELSTALNQNVMAVIVEVPSKDDDPRYTILDRKGELYFVEKSAFKLRIPGLIPRGWVRDVVEEAKYDSPFYGSIKTTVDHKFESYLINPLARRIIMDPVLRITNEAWAQLPEISRRLEILHRVVQDNGPKQISIFALAEAVSSIIPEKFKDNVEMERGTIRDEYANLSNILYKKFGADYNLHKEFNLGKEISFFKDSDEVRISHLYAVILGLRKQSRLWSTSYSSRSAMMPTSITVNSLEYVNEIDNAVNVLKQDSGLIKRFVQFVESKDYKTVPEEFDSILKLLKEYSVGNITDAVSETVICQMMKNIKTIADSDITRTHVYDLLAEIGYISKVSTNPVHFSNSLCIPGKGVSTKADNEQDYFDAVDISQNQFPDVSESIRKDYTDMNVYCIDSETAHEIDDGVSIQKIDESTVMLYAHIADPASYLSPANTISKIAFERAFTTYQPELVSPMLPKQLADLCGLGVDGRKTRALTFSVPFNMNSGLLLKAAKVQPSYVSKFPKYTYDRVDETLQKTKNKSEASLSDEERDLNDLFKIAKMLRDDRISNGAITFGESIQTQATITEKGKPQEENALIDSSLDEGSDVLFTKQKLTDSVTLVSEMMILANRVGAQVMTEHQIPGIFKGMKSLKLEGTADNVVKSLNKYAIETGKLPGLAEVVKAIKYVNPAFYFPKKVEHLMLGVSGYLPSTSPLRRFGDLINHWQFHSYYNDNKPLFDTKQMIYMALHIEARNDIIKQAQRQSNTFYSMSHIKSVLSSGKPVKLSFMVWSRPHDNFVSGMIVEFGIFARLGLNLNKRPPKIGDLITEFDVVELDPVGGSLFIQQH